MVCSRYPKECRYYEGILKRKCFKKLRNNVWESKTKWILIEKAENHYRIKLLYKYFNLWMIYIRGRYKKKINLRITDALYEEKLKTKVILALKKNIEKNQKLLRISKRKFEFSLKYKCWHQWKHYVQKRLKVREVKVLADRIREERLRIKFFYMWMFCLNEKQLFKDGYKLAVVKHETKLKEKCFKYWKIFTKKQVCKGKIEKLAIACYKDKLKEKYICCWKNYTCKKKQYKFQVNIIQNFYENFIIKNYLNQWWIAYKNFQYKNQIYKSNLAINFYYRRLLEKGFKTLWKVRTVKKARQEKVQKFRYIYVKIYLDFYLDVWAKKRSEKIVWNVLENNANEWREDYLRELFLKKLLHIYQERIEEKEELNNVIRYSNVIIIHRAFRGWREITDNKIQKKIQLENAAKHYIDTLVKNSFEKWKKFVLRRSRKKMAADYYRFILLLRLMTQWKIFFKKRKLKLAEACILEQKHNTKLVKNAFDCWKSETEISKTKINAAIYFYDRSNLSKTFYEWRKNIQFKTFNKIRFDRNKTIFNEIIIKNTIFRWCEIFSVNQRIKKMLQEFKSRHEKRVLDSHFSTWHRFAMKMKTIHQNMIVYIELRVDILIEQYLIILSEAVKSKKILNKKIELAEKIEEKLLKKRYLRKWMSFISWKREKIERCMSEERKLNSEDACEFFIPAGKTKRRQPMIPGYLKPHQFYEEDATNLKTYRVERPINKNIFFSGPKESFVSFEV